jgi:hypothetical protein
VCLESDASGIFHNGRQSLSNWQLVRGRPFSSTDRFSLGQFFLTCGASIDFIKTCPGASWSEIFPARSGKTSKTAFLTSAFPACAKRSRSTSDERGIFGSESASLKISPSVAAAPQTFERAKIRRARPSEVGVGLVTGVAAATDERSASDSARARPEAKRNALRLLLLGRSFKKRGMPGARLLALQTVQHGIEYARDTLVLALYEAAGDAQIALDNRETMDLLWRGLAAPTEQTVPVLDAKGPRAQRGYLSQISRSVNVAQYTLCLIVRALFRA